MYSEVNKCEEGKWRPVVVKHLIYSKGTSSVMFPEVVVGFRRIFNHQTPSLRQPSWCWLRLSLWAISTLPWIQCLDSDPPGGFLCCLCAVLDGPHPPVACDAECSVSTLPLQVRTLPFSLVCGSSMIMSFVVSDTRMMSGVRVVLETCWGNLSWPPKFTVRCWSR